MDEDNNNTGLSGLVDFFIEKLKLRELALKLRRES
jgi:hypothetical protein